MEAVLLTFDIEADEMEMFLQDVNDLLQDMESGILRLEQARPGQAPDPDTINSIFRAAHTLKALAGAVGHHKMAEITHTLENFFDEMRNNGQARGPAPTDAVVDELLGTVDVLAAMRDEIITRQPSGLDADACLARLRDLAGDGAGQASEGPAALPSRHALTAQETAQVSELAEKGQAILEVAITADPDGFVPAARLMQAAIGLADMGDIVFQHPSQESLVSNPKESQLWLLLASEAGPAEVESILADISDIAEFSVLPFQLESESPAPVVQTTPSPDTLATTQSSAPAPSKAPSVTGNGGDTTVRISVERLDSLMNLVGELITDRTHLEQTNSTLRSLYRKDETVASLETMTTHFTRIVDQLQEEVMRARLLPIGTLFSKFPRLVRDVSRAAGKQVDLVIEGEATELDRSIIEVIGDPLIHLIRNSADHGVESPEQRIAAGKPATGTVRLTAGHEQGHIIITVSDDGAGIDPDRIRQAAVDKGMMTSEDVAQLDDDEAINLIFRPNLSTKKEVTEISGRGVGMDVVRTNVERLNGSVVVESEIGVGSTFRLTLPLTLAIVQTMMVGLGDDIYAIPLASIIDSLYLDDVSVSSVKGYPVIQWRDQVLPLLYLRSFYSHRRLGALSSNGHRQGVITVAWGKLRLGLVVDHIVGKQEIVVKSFSPIIGQIPGLSGCTILGDGSIALIMDIPGLVSAATQERR